MESCGGICVCRLCLTFEGRMLNIFENGENSGVRLADIIEDFLHLKVSNEEAIPWMVCCDCVAKLRDFHEYKERAIKYYKLLGTVEGSGQFLRKNLEDAILALNGHVEKGCSSADISSPEKQPECEEEESFCLMLESDSDEEKEPMCGNGNTLVAASEASSTPKAKVTSPHGNGSGEDFNGTGTDCVPSDVPCLPLQDEDSNDGSSRRCSPRESIRVGLKYSDWLSLFKNNKRSYRSPRNASARCEKLKSNVVDPVQTNATDVEDGVKKTAHVRGSNARVLRASLRLSLPETSRKGEVKRNGRKKTNSEGSLVLRKGRGCVTVAGSEVKNSSFRSS